MYTYNRDSIEKQSKAGRRAGYLTLAFALAIGISAAGSSNLQAGSLADPGIPDTVRIHNTEGFRGGKVVVPVSIFNDESLGGAELTLKFDSANLILDSVSFLGGLAEHFSAKFVTIDSIAGVVDAAVIGLDSNSTIPPGSGTLARLFFSVSMTAPVGDLFIDTTSIHLPGGAVRATVFSTLQTDTSNNETVFPVFVGGAITVPEREATNDSIWVENVTAVAGGSFSADIMIANEANLVTLNVPLTYSTPALTLDSVSFAGTRGILAGKSRLAQRQDTEQQVLITLEYFDTSPLAPGSGSLARLFFSAADTATAQTVPLDTVTFLGIQGLEATTTVAEGSVTLVPIFIAGSVQIDIATDVEIDEPLALPDEFTLDQNYPNPFNPTTTIAFGLPQLSEVRLEVFNVLGQHVRTLLDGRMPAGEHSVEFDGKNDNGQSLASGIYFYRLSTAKLIKTYKMTLMK